MITHQSEAINQSKSTPSFETHGFLQRLIGQPNGHMINSRMSEIVSACYVKYKHAQMRLMGRVNNVDREHLHT